MFDSPENVANVNITDAKVLNRADTRYKSPNRAFTVFKNCRPYSASENVPWAKTNDYGPLLSNDLTEARTIIYMKARNTLNLIGQPA